MAEETWDIVPEAGHHGRGGCGPLGVRVGLTKEAKGRKALTVNIAESVCESLRWLDNDRVTLAADRATRRLRLTRVVEGGQEFDRRAKKSGRWRMSLTKLNNAPDFVRLLEGLLTTSQECEYVVAGATLYIDLGNGHQRAVEGGR